MTWLTVTLAILLVLSVMLRRRYGNVAKRIGDWIAHRLGAKRARLIVQGIFFATLLAWAIVWLAVSKETRKELTRRLWEEAPWRVEAPTK